MDNLPPPPELPIEASHVVMGHHAIFVTVSDPTKRASVATKCERIGRTELQQGSQNCFWVHLLATYLEAQIPALIAWIKSLA